MFGLLYFNSELCNLPSGSLLEHFKRRPHYQSAAKLPSIQFWEIRHRYWMQFLSLFSRHGRSLDSHSEWTPGHIMTHIDSILASHKIISSNIQHLSKSSRGDMKSQNSGPTMLPFELEMQRGSRHCLSQR
jgi:hypothetical protein